MRDQEFADTIRPLKSCLGAGGPRYKYGDGLTTFFKLDEIKSSKNDPELAMMATCIENDFFDIPNIRTKVDIEMKSKSYRAKRAPTPDKKKKSKSKSPKGGKKGKSGSKGKKKK